VSGICRDIQGTTTKGDITMTKELGFKEQSRTWLLSLPRLKRRRILRIRIDYLKTKGLER
jgi:hypothetical protein